MSESLETERLILRRWRDSDHAPFADLCADDRVMRHFPRPLTRAESDAFVVRAEAHFTTHGFGRFAVEVKACKSFAGFVGLDRPTAPLPFSPCVEIGWRIAFDFQGCGIATEAARAVLDYGLSDIGLDEIVSFTATENLASRRVMEKIGMVRDASGEFDHPSLPVGHALRRHVLYRVSRRAGDGVS